MQALMSFITELTGLEGALVMTIAYAICIGSLLGFVTVYTMFIVWVERKVAAHIQVRLGPMETGGWHGWAQTIADPIKLLFKEDLVPDRANKFLFWIAPAIVLCGVFAGFIVIPFAAGIQIAQMHLGIFFLISVASIEVVGVIMAGWSSNSKYSLFGAVREAAQVVSYELPAATALIAPILIVGSFQLGDFNVHQAEHGWLIFANPFMPIAALCYFISSMAGCKRAPFDLPEAESELVSGFHTEYSGMRFSFFALEEYASMFIVSALISTLYFGGTTLPFNIGDFGNWAHYAERADGSVITGLGDFIRTHLGLAVLLAKVFFFVFVQMWLRWTLPRLRVDQVMTLGYKYLLPWGLLTVVGTAVFEAFGWGWLPH